MNPRELIKVGKIVGTHGYKGSVKVQPLTDFPERFQPGNKFIVVRGEHIKELVLVSCSSHKGPLLMKFQDIDDMETAERYRNLFLSVTSDQLYPLPDGSYYHFQLIGMRVEDIDKGYLGVLSEVLETGANDVYVVKSDTYGEILIPAIKQVVLSVNVNHQLMQVRLLEGLLGEQE